MLGRCENQIKNTDCSGENWVAGKAEPISPRVAASLWESIGTLRYEDGKARTGTAVDAGNFRGSRWVVKNKMLKMHIFSEDGDVNNSNFVKAIPFTETVTSFRL